MTAPTQNRDPLPHIRVDRFRTSSAYQPTGGGGESADSTRDRGAHGTRLVREYLSAFASARAELGEYAIQEWDGKPGIYLEFESAPGHPLPEINWQDGIRMGAARASEDRSEVGALYVPLDRQGTIQKKLDDYLNVNTKKKGNPKNQPLVEAIERISAATVASLWTDPRPLPLDPQEPRWWECWCWSNSTNHLDAAAGRLRLRVGDQSRWLSFPDFDVVPVYGSTNDINRLIRSSDAIAELRSAMDSAWFFTSVVRDEQSLWVGDLLGRLVSASKDSPAVCILDTGVAWAHPLLEGSLDKEDCQTVVPAWQSNDTSEHGHGTQMAGAVLFSDLTYPLAGQSVVEPGIRLESVKILPPHGLPGNHPSTFGPFTQSGVALAEIKKPLHPRAFCMAITNEDVFGDIPRSWSAALDQICSGTMKGEQDNGDQKEIDEKSHRLFMVSAGNIRNKDARDGIAYPELFPIEDPAQAWNALTIGGYTDKVDIDHPNLRGWMPVALVGDRSPYSRISTAWPHRTTPVKPELVFEAGNRAKSPNGTDIQAGVESLSLLTTSRDFLTNPAVLVEETHGTSPATAQAAGMAGRIMAEHPKLWPETIRALMVHSASWSPEMLRQFDDAGKRTERAKVLRRFGYGIPSLPRALASASNDVVLLAEGHIQPFRKGDDGEGRLNEAHYYKLPWPKQELENLADEVQLKVTLSYFVEPNPGQLPGAGAAPSRYRSHGLRFDLKRSQESSIDFFGRKNATFTRSETYQTVDDDDYWFFGPDSIFGAGSLHCDVWKGPAAYLAARDEIAVFPVKGWWYSRKRLKRMDDVCRYSLIVSLTAPDLDVDLYTEIMQATRIEPEAEISI